MLRHWDRVQGGRQGPDEDWILLSGCSNFVCDLGRDIRCIPHADPPLPALTCSRQLTAPQKPHTAQERQDPCIYCRKTRSTREWYTDPTWDGAPTCGGQGWVTASEAWRGPQHQRCLGRLASSQGGLQPPLPPSPVLPRMGKAGQERPGVAQRLCYQGVSLRKGCDPLSSQEPLLGLGSRWQLRGPGLARGQGSASLRLGLQAMGLPVSGTQKGAQ